MTNLGGGALAGLAVGYAIKRTTRLLLWALGLAIVAMYALTHAGIVTVHWHVLEDSLEAGGKGLGHWLMGLVKELSATLVGFGGGVLMGLRFK